MAQAGNHITLVGNLTRDPELRYTPAGQATCTFGLAVTRRWQNRQTQEWEEATSFFDCVAWRETAENVEQTYKRGMRVIVDGTLEQRSWETPEGEKKSRTEVIIDETGPAMRWASAVVTRNERQGGNSNGREPARQGAQQAPAGGYGDDEEPF